MLHYDRYGRLRKCVKCDCPAKDQVPISSKQYPEVEMWLWFCTDHLKELGYL